MPSIQGVLVRSLRAGVFEIVRRQTTFDDVVNAAEDFAGSLDGAEDTAGDVAGTANDAADTVNDIQTALSSWDNCMSVSWCQYPVIAVIVIGALIVFSIAWCIIRCMCCGLSCCCSCFSCFKCCGNCCGCCDSPQRDNKRGQHLEEPPIISPNQGYTSHPPMMTGATTSAAAVGSASSYNRTATQQQKSSPSMYAEFDVSKKGDEDALPQMPTWEAAQKEQVALEEEKGLELKDMKGLISPDLNSSQSNLPLMAAAASSGVSTGSPQRRQFSPQPTGYGAPANDPYAAPRSQAGYSDQDQYSMSGAAGVMSGSQNAYGNASGYGQQQQMGAEAYGRKSPHAQDPYAQPQGRASPRAQDPYAQLQGRMSPRVQDPYAQLQGRTSPRAQDPYAQQPTNPLDIGFQQQGYGQGQYSGRVASPPQGRSTSPYAHEQASNSGGYPHGSQRTYTGESQRHVSPPPAQAQDGFDFGGSSFTRPPGPPARQNTGGSFTSGGGGVPYPGKPGYKPPY